MIHPSIDVAYLRLQVECFSAGNIGEFVQNWKKLTSDSTILDIIKHGLKLNFHDQPPESRKPFEYPRTDYETIDTEVKKLLMKGVVEHSQREIGEYFSNLFTTPKKDGSLEFEVLE